MRKTALIVLPRCALLGALLAYLLLTQGRPAVTRIDGASLASHASLGAFIDQVMEPAASSAPYVGASVAIVRPGEDAWRDFAVQLGGQAGVRRVLLSFPLAMAVMEYLLGEGATLSKTMPPVPVATTSDPERFVGDYWPAQRSVGTIEIPLVFREALRVWIADDGTLRIGKRDGFREIAPLAFARPGLDRMAAFVEEDGEIVAFATAYPRYYERLSGLASPRALQIWHLGFSFLCLLGLFAVRWPWGGVAFLVARACWAPGVAPWRL